MKKILPLSLLLTVLFVVPVLNAKDHTPDADSCEFVSLMVNEGGSAGIEKLVEMFSWNNSTGEVVRDSLGLFKGFEYVDGSVNVVADFGEVFKQIFIVLATEKKGNFYVHLNFEHYEGDLNLSNVSAKGNYHEIIAEHGAFAQEPREIECAI